MKLKQKAAEGVLWSSGGRVFSIGIQFIITISLVRLLTPEDFGFLAMVMVLVGFAQKFNDLGFGSALVQRHKINRDHISTVFWINFLFGSILFGVFWGIAPIVADFYSETSLIKITYYLSFIFLIGSIGYVPNALLQRNMKFERLAKLEVISISLSGITAVMLAYNGWGVMSLVTQLLIKSLFDSLGAWFLVDVYPRFQISHKAFKEIFWYSIGYSGFNIVNYWSRKVDDLLVGRLMGSYALGVYDRAYQLMLKPISLIIEVISKVMFPALSSIKAEKERVKRIYLQTVSLLAFVIFPMMAGLYVLAEPVVLTIFGKQWIDVIPIIKVLCPVGLMQVLTIPTGWIYTSQGRTDWMFWWGLGGGGFLIIALSIGAWFGTVMSVALSYLFANIILLYPCITISGKLIGLSFGEVMQKVWAILLAALCMAVVVLGVRLIIPGNWSYWVNLIIFVVAGVLCYVSIMIVFKLKVYREFMRLAIEQWHRMKAPQKTLLDE